MGDSDSFFGFDTRLPEDIERDSGSSGKRDVFADLGLDDLRLDEGMSSSYENDKVSADPWLVASSELNKLDMREFFADIRSPPPRYLSDDLLPRDLDMESGTKWINRSLSGLAGERDADESLNDRLARLIDEDTFSLEQTKGNYAAPSTSEADFGFDSYSNASTSRADDRSPWAPTSGSFGTSSGTWSPVESSSRSIYGSQINASTEPPLPAPSRDPPTSVPLIRKTMTLEELEASMIPRSPASDRLVESASASSQMSSTDSRRVFQQTANPQFSATALHSPSVTPLPQHHFTDQVPFQHQHRQNGQQYRFPGSAPRNFVRYPPGMMPRAQQGVPQNMRPPYQHQYQHQTRIFENANAVQFLPPVRLPNGSSGGPMRSGPQQWMRMVPGGMRGPRPGFYPGLPFQYLNRPIAAYGNYSVRPYGYNQENENFEDEGDCGWMTEREKEWVIKIQQSQVKTENPYLDDYYYYVRSLKKSMKESGMANDKEQDFIMPARMISEPKEERQNVFEGSLGKVCISSVFNPRKTVDIDASNMAKNRLLPTNQKRKWFVDPLQKEKGHPKGLLLGIEELYKQLIELQDHSRGIAALPENQRDPGAEHRRNTINLIFDKLIQGTNPDARIRSFCDTLKIRKGRELIRRVLPILFKEQVLILTGYCVRALPILVDPALDRHEGFIRCLSVVNESLESAVFRRLVEMIQPMVESKHGMLNTVYNGQNLLAQAVKSLFALNFLALLIARAEQCYASEWEELSAEEQEQWTLFITHFLISLTKANPLEVAVVSDPEIYNSVATHIGRFPFSMDQVEVCREKLRKPF